jgi:hypothetical protein
MDRSRGGELMEGLKEIRAVLYVLLERLQVNNYDGEEGPYIEECEDAIWQVESLIKEHLEAV